MSRPSVSPQVYGTIRYDDGRTVNVKFFNDTRGLRAYQRNGRDITLLDSWEGAALDARKTAGRFVLTLYGIDEPAGFTVEHWGECLGCTRNPLKGFRAPQVWEEP